MAEDIFRSGSLDMPQCPVDSIAPGCIPADRITSGLVILAVIVTALILSTFFRLAPTLFGSVTRKKLTMDLEHNISMARQRNNCALAALLPFILICNRYRLFDPSFMDCFSQEWSIAVTAGVFLLFLLLRYILSCLFRPRAGREISDASAHVSRNYFIMLCVLMTVSLGVLFVFKATDSVCKNIFLCECALFYALSAFRRGHILSQNCSGFSTFLYLCALEIVPLAILIAARVL